MVTFNRLVLFSTACCATAQHHGSIALRLVQLRQGQRAVGVAETLLDGVLQLLQICGERQPLLMFQLTEFLYIYCMYTIHIY